MSATTSAQPMPLAPINTLRTRSDSNGMGSPSSLTSGFSTGSPLAPVFTENTSEESSITASVAPLRSEAQKTTRPTLHQTTTNESRKSTDSVDSQGRPRFNDLGRGRHSNSWLFGGFSVRGTIGKIVHPKH